MTKKTDTAIALQYSQSDSLPYVTALGHNKIAEKILALARENDIPIYRDDTLSQLLSNVKVGESVPERSLAILADVVAFLYHIERNL